MNVNYTRMPGERFRKAKEKQWKEYTRIKGNASGDLEIMAMTTMNSGIHGVTGICCSVMNLLRFIKI